MDKVVELHPDGRAIVNMGFGETSIEARNFLATIAHLVQYSGPESRWISFRIDSCSVRQAAEWGIAPSEMVAKLLCVGRFGIVEYTAKDRFSFWLQFYKWPCKIEVSREMGKYSRWISHMYQFGKIRAVDFWTRLRVVQNIWINKGCGRGIQMTKLQFGARNAIYTNKVGTWNDLVKFAGYDPDEERVQEKWSREKIIAELQETKRKGKSISPGHWRSKLAQVVPRYFESSDDAIRAAGFDPEQERVRFQTREQVIARLQELHAAGEAINWLSLKRNHKKLSHALNGFFGSWQRAALAAGFDPDGDWPGEKAIFGRRYTIEEVLGYIILGHARGDKLTAEVLRIENWSMLCSGEEHFGTWDNARRAAGLSSVYEAWSRERVIVSFQSIKANGEPINHGYIANMYPKLEHAIGRYFDYDWKEAIEAAGFDSEVEKQKESWSAEKITADLRSRKQKGELINYNALSTNLAGAMVRYFGSWEQAVRAAGFDPEEERINNEWNRERIVGEIQLLKESGYPINAKALPAKLYASIPRYFGSWERAVQEAGFSPDEERKIGVWDQESIVAELKRLKKISEEISASSLRENHCKLGNAIYRHFDSWAEAVSTAGFYPAQETRRASALAKKGKGELK